MTFDAALRWEFRRCYISWKPGADGETYDTGKFGDSTVFQLAKPVAR
jgi:hypothetical protein